MMDTVWIRLTLAPVKDVTPTDGEEMFMFGPTGVVRFGPNEAKDATILYTNLKVPIAVVKEDSEWIMTILRKMRGTEGRLDEKQDKKTKSKRKTPPSKKTSKSR